MKKYCLTLIILLVFSLNAFADFTPHENGSGSFDVYAYYKGQNHEDKAVSITITDGSSNAIYHGTTTTVTFNNTDQDSFHFDPIFSWILQGDGFNSNCPITITFTFKALIAYIPSNQTYYVPGHSFSMSTPVVSAGSTMTVDTNNTNMDAFLAQTGDYQYPNYNNNEIYRKTKYTGTMVPDENHSWSVSGSCRLDVTSYSKLSGVAFDYKGDVKVEFTAQ